MSETNKTTSIAMQLNRHIQWERFSSIIGSLLLIILASSIGWICALEANCGAVCEPFMKRGLSFSQTGNGFFAWMKSAVYYFVDADGMQHSYAAGSFISGLFWVMCVFLVINLIGWVLSWAEERNRLRTYLAPIDEIALSAEKIAQQSFDPKKFQSFEDAIARIDAPDTEVHVHDGDLAGLEAAVNNMLKRLQESARMQTRFVDDASHELRTPIAVIQGYVNMLDRWGKNDPQVLSESITAIQTEAEHMKILVEQLLFLARGDMGRQHFKSEDIQLAPFMHEICDESRMIDDKHQYKLQINDELSIKADLAMLKQAIRILIDNAVKYTDAGGEITLRVCKSEAGEARIDVQDSGIGIAKSDVAHMFERFYRADSARSRQGCGLGLSIARWIIEQHDGHIEVTSYEDLGTRVSICMPM